MLRRYLSLTVLLVMLGSTPASATGAQAPLAGGGMLRPGDHLRITVLSDDKNLSGEFEVAPDSTLKHPIYNQIKVAGIPIAMLRDRISTFLRKFQREPQLEVEPLFKITIAGEVRNPNIYLLPPETTVADAIAKSGGATDRGDLNRVTVLRDGRKISVSMNSKSVAAPQVSTIESGDQITIPARRSALGGIGQLGPLVGVAASIVSIIVMSSR